MAKRQESYHYFFKLQSSGSHIVLSKMTTDGDHVLDYSLKGNLSLDSGFSCDCPASFHRGYKGRCKHMDWVRRYMILRHKLEEGIPVYFDTGENAFYTAPIFSDEGGLVVE